MALKEFLARYGTYGELPKIAGTYRGGIVVCGDAACVWDDLFRFGCAVGNGVAKAGWDFMTINRAVETFPGRVEHAYSNVSAVLKRFVAARRDDYAHEFGPPVTTHSRTVGTDWVWPWHGGGTSGLGGILTAIALGYDEIVLAGIPLNDGPHNGEPPWRKTRFSIEVLNNDQQWLDAIELAFERKVKSLSGRTREWFGEP